METRFWGQVRKCGPVHVIFTWIIMGRGQGKHLHSGIREITFYSGIGGSIYFGLRVSIYNITTPLYGIREIYFNSGIGGITLISGIGGIIHLGITQIMYSSITQITFIFGSGQPHTSRKKISNSLLPLHKTCDYHAPPLYQDTTQTYVYYHCLCSPLLINNLPSLYRI